MEQQHQQQSIPHGAIVQQQPYNTAAPGRVLPSKNVKILGKTFNKNITRFPRIGSRDFAWCSTC